jgi:acyl-CoA synthetase (AMP-forming)/AMP-acid ligase II
MHLLRQHTTLIDLLQERAQAHPDSIALHFAGHEIGWQELWGAVCRFSRLLAGAGLGVGDRVVIVLPNGPDFFAAFYGTQRAGGIPVPLFPESGAARIAAFAQRADAGIVVIRDEAVRRELLHGDAAGSSTVAGSPRILRVSDEVPAGGTAARMPTVPAEHPALIQYTSGSTGAPKGVVIRHDNLLTNMGQMIEGMEISPDDIFVSWLPACHDMGLILMTMVPMALGAKLVLLPSRLNDVRRWPAALDRHHATFTAAPDFAYRLCLRMIRDASRFDLSSLRVALNAAEPVRAETMRRFEEAFGLRRVMVPGYGLAEATVGVSMQPPGTEPAVDPRGLVAIGRPFAGIRLHIVKDDHHAAVGEVGEIMVESTAATSGYFRDPEATAELFWRPGCLRTGDLGYRDEQDNVFLVGRTKNSIIQAGRNLAPQELEEAAESLPYVRRAAAVGIDRGRMEGEQAYLFAELRRAARPPRETLEAHATEIVATLHRRLGLRPGRVILLERRSIPLTPNGKIRHPELRAAYLEGRLEEAGKVLFPTAS